VADFHIGDTIVHLSRQVLMTGAREVLVYVTLQGMIGVLIPYVSKEDVEMFHKLEMQLRESEKSLSGRHHMYYRGAYIPVRSVIDGDLCERYTTLTYEQREAIAEQLDTTPGDISKQLELIRTRVAF
jgi:splicing factor 3B subunit 3